jgi:soluble lytic murein transglycosylase-like protein
LNTITRSELLKIGHFTAILIIITALPVCADIYKYIDGDGVLHFTDVPVSKGQDRLYIMEQPKKIKKIYSSRKYDRYISAASRKYGVSFHLLKAMIKVESDFNPRAVSRAGAKGLMQIMPLNFNSLKITDPFNPKENIYGGTQYLRKLLEHYDGKLTLALAAYNAGPTTVDQYETIPPFPETQQYVKKVLKYYYAYKR